MPVLGAFSVQLSEFPEESVQKRAVMTMPYSCGMAFAVDGGTWTCAPGCSRG
jgi:hypothetical protein